MNNDILSIILWISTGGFGLLAGVFGVATTKRRMTAGEAESADREKSIIKAG